MRRTTLLALACLALPAGAALGQEQLKPAFSIWDVVLGQPVAQVPEIDAGLIACGTNGGPPGQPLQAFEDFAACPPEASGLHEVAFTYDDEQDFIALARGVQYKFLQGGTSVFAQPVIISLLVDDAGLVQGRRIVTDDRVGDSDRRNAYTLIRNFKARYGDWALECSDIPMKEGEQPVGKQFYHEACLGQSPDGASRIAIEGSYLRKKGQSALNQESQTVNKGYFQSQARYEEVLAPYEPGAAP